MLSWEHRWGGLPLSLSISRQLQSRGQVPSVDTTDGHPLYLRGPRETSRRACVCLASQLRSEATCIEGLESVCVDTELF